MTVNLSLVFVELQLIELSLVSNFVPTNNVKALYLSAFQLLRKVNYPRPITLKVVLIVLVLKSVSVVVILIVNFTEALNGQQNELCYISV